MKTTFTFSSTSHLQAGDVLAGYGERWVVVSVDSATTVTVKSLADLTWWVYALAVPAGLAFAALSCAAVFLVLRWWLS